MKKVLFTISLLFLLAIAKSQYALIPDTAFISWLNNNGFAACLNGSQLDTACPAVLNADTLRPNNSAIFNLTGIQYFKNLVYLDCSYDSITVIPAFPQALVTINCAANKLDSLPALPLTLNYLNCDSDSITSLPALPAALISLTCTHCRLQHLPALPAALQSLTCYSNQIDSLPVLPGSLYWLLCFDNKITSLPTLPPALNLLFCWRNHLNSLPALPDSLVYLECYKNTLDSLPSLPPSLQILICNHDHLTTIPALPQNLTYLDVSYNLLTALPVLPDSLGTFDCSANSDLYCLPQLNKITNLYFDSTGITCLPNYGQVAYSRPPLDSVPLCAAGNPNGCEVLSVSELSSENWSLNIYPNPIANILNLEFAPASPNTSFQILSADGRLLVSLAFLRQNRYELDVSNLSAGMYFIQLQDGQQSLVRKFVKE